jgi:hypothetical protein
MNMPTVLRIGKLRIVIYLNEHEPEHVHVLGTDGEAKIELGTGRRKPRIIRNDGLRSAELAMALRVVDANQALLQRKWKEIHGGTVD